MPRGGRRENAGKKSTWDSGRTFAETKVIRVPIEFASQLLELAHRLDTGEVFDLVTNSLVENDEVEILRGEVNRLQERVNQLESQLSHPLLKQKQNRALSKLNMGSAAARYKDANKVLTAFIEDLVSST